MPSNGSRSERGFPDARIKPRCRVSGREVPQGQRGPSHFPSGALAAGNTPPAGSHCNSDPECVGRVRCGSNRKYASSRITLQSQIGKEEPCCFRAKIQSDQSTIHHEGVNREAVSHHRNYPLDQILTKIERNGWFSMFTTSSAGGLNSLQMRMLVHGCQSMPDAVFGLRNRCSTN
jgi:hypothetical protein